MAFDRPSGPRGPRSGGSRSGGFGGERKPYAKREGGERGSYGRDGGERRPYTPRAPREDGERRPYTPREGGSSFGGERKPYAKREGGYSRDGGERRPYTPREGGSSFGGERKPYAKREGGYSREGGERRPYTPRAPREGGFDGERAPRRDFAERAPREDRTPNTQGQYFDTKPLSEGFVFGTHAVVAVLKAGRRAVRELWVTHEPVGELAEALAARSDITPLMKAKPELDSKFDGMAHQGVAALVGNLPQPELGDILAGIAEAKKGVVLAVDQVTDPHNLGAILRSCAAFNVLAVLVPEHRTATVGPVVAKVAAGALETVPVVSIGNLAQTLKMLQERNFAVLGLAGEEDSVDIGTVTVNGPLCVVVGSEGEGLRRLTRENCTQLVRIPMSNAVESLNVSVATGVALYTLTAAK